MLYLSDLCHCMSQACAYDGQSQGWPEQGAKWQAQDPQTAGQHYQSNHWEDQDVRNPAAPYVSEYNASGQGYEASEAAYAHQVQRLND